MPTDAVRTERPKVPEAPRTRRIRIAFVATNALIDPSSGAAISVRTILELLAAEGAICKSFTQTVFDKSPYSTAKEALDAIGATPANPTDKAQWVWKKTVEGVDHFLNRTSSLYRRRLSAIDELRFYHAAHEFLTQFRPDVVIIYGNGLPELSIMRVAHSLGAITCFYLVNPSYRRKSDFDAIDLVLTDTISTQNLYRERFNMPSAVIGKFIKMKPPTRPDSARDRITFVNPSPEKGVLIFYEIARMLQEKMPEERFLVVESRANLQEIEAKLKVPFSSLRNIETVGLQPDLGDVLSRTKILLFPSLWHDSGPRTLLEASSHGIPVIACDHGGPPELLAGAGVLLPVPLESRKNHIAPVKEEDVRPWFQALLRLLEDPAHYSERRAAGLRVWEENNPQNRIRGLIKLFRKTMAEKKATTAKA